MWSYDILGELQRQLFKRYTSLSIEQVNRIVLGLQSPDYIVHGYEWLVPHVYSPDPDDRHVIAAAVHLGADTIISDDLKGFPPDALAPYNIRHVTSDQFLMHMLGLSASAVISVVQDVADDLGGGLGKVLEALYNGGAVRSLLRLRPEWNWV